MATFQVADGVYGIDVELFDEGVVSVYLFDDEDPTLVDAGAAAGADRILDGLAACGLDPGDLANVVLSHVHADHTGAASAIADAAPDADVYIHELTAPHLVDPSGLIESSRRAMGEHFELLGEQGPVPENRVVPVTDDGLALDTGEHTLELIHAPGHSPDHLAVWSPGRGVLFAAECLGLYFPRADRWTPPSTLPNFDVGVLADTIDDLRGFDPDEILLPHFGAWPDDPEAAFETAAAELHRFDEWICERHDATGSVEATIDAVAADLLALSGPYDPVVESFYANLVTKGYLKQDGRL